MARSRMFSLVPTRAVGVFRVVLNPALTCTAADIVDIVKTRARTLAGYTPAVDIKPGRKDDSAYYVRILWTSVTA